MRECPSDRRFLKCNQRHHTQLHDEAFPSSSQDEVQQVKQVEVSSIPVNAESQAVPFSIPLDQATDTVAATCSMNNVSCRKTVLLLTAMVNVIDRQGKLDSGSQVNLISKELVDILGIERRT